MLAPVYAFFLQMALFALFVISRMLLSEAAGPQCKPIEESVRGKALKGHTFKTSVVQDPNECLFFCESELTCQSYNYFMPKRICELNNRTKEARPDDFVPDKSRFYMRRWANRGTEKNGDPGVNYGMGILRP